MAKARGLGKGLSSLIPISEEEIVESIAPDAERSDDILPCDMITPNPFQPRKSMNDENLEGLILSVREHGIIQPILVRQKGRDYQIIAGERRWRAAVSAGLTEVPVRILKISDAQAMELALVENIQREDLSAIEVANGIHDLISKLSLTHEEVAKKIGISRAAVTNKLRLLQLPTEVIEMLNNETITEGHARALLSLPSAEKIIDFAKLAAEKSLNVRQLEQLVRSQAAAARLDAILPRKSEPESEFTETIERFNTDYKLSVKIAGNRRNMGLMIKGLKKWQIELLLEYIDRYKEELFPKE